MEIGLFADGIWGVNTLNKFILNLDIKINFVCLRYKKPDLIIKKVCQKNNIEILCIKNINTKNSILILQKYKCDIYVSMSYNQIFSSKFIDCVGQKIINCHAGKLPFYRGRSILNWVLINGEKEFGITVHIINKYIDKGDIIIQNTYPIKESDNYNSLLKKCYIECPKLLLNAIKKIKKNNYQLKKQNNISKIGSYYKKRVEGDEVIDWNRSSRDIFNFVRALVVPGPIAQSKINKKKIYIMKVRIVKDYDTTIISPGIVVKVMSKSFIVSTLNGYISVIESSANLKKIKKYDKFL